MNERTSKDFGRLATYVIMAICLVAMCIGLFSCRTSKRGYVNATCWEFGERAFSGIVFDEYVLDTSALRILKEQLKRDTIKVHGYVSYVTPYGIKTERAIMIKCQPKHEFPYVISITANSMVIDITKQYTFTPDSELQPKDTNNLFIGSHLPSHSTGNICEYHKTNNKPCDTLH